MFAATPCIWRLTISQLDHQAARLAAALDRLEALVSTREAEHARLRHIEDEARAALRALDTLLEGED